MPLGVLITQCLQHDFVAPLAAGQPVPNPLHVGHAEARRLLGEEPDQGPLARFLRWAHDQKPEQLQLVHIRDWHDAKDPSQAAHLARFGYHCLRDSAGAAFVPGIDAARPNVHVVNAVDLNDFNETPLPQVLDELRKRSPDGALRVGVLGVWTDAKVSFLLYDLKTRGAISELCNLLRVHRELLARAARERARPAQPPARRPRGSLARRVCGVAGGRARGGSWAAEADPRRDGAGELHQGAA